MIRIRGSDQASRIDDSDVRRLVEQRFAEVCNGEPYDPDIHGEMIVVETGDTLESLEEDTGLPIAHNPYDESHFPEDPDFITVAEHVEEHVGAYEMTFILTDDGAGVILFIPRQPGIDVQLRDLCARFAVPAATPVT
jgi:hypothetical protein